MTIYYGLLVIFEVIVVITSICTVLSLVVALTLPPRYTSLTRVIREPATSGNSTVSGGFAALRGFGFNIGSGSIGLTPETYPEILKSWEVGLDVIQSRYYFADIGDRMTLVDYYNRPSGPFVQFLGILRKGTIGLPRTIIRLFRKEAPPIPQTSNYQAFPSKRDEEVLRFLQSMMAVSVDRQSGVMNISVTTYNSLLSTDIARNFLNNLSRRIQEIETKKARENLKFIEDRFLEVQKDLIVAEEQLARFTDSNLNVCTAKLRIEMERYQRNVTFKTQLYASSFLFSWTKRFKKHRSEDLIRTQDEFNQNIRV